LLIIDCLVFITSFAFFYYLVSSILQRHLRLESRIRRLEPNDEPGAVPEPDVRFRDRMILPVLRGIATRVARFTPGEWKERTVSLLEKAGHPFGFHLQEWMAVRLLAALAGLITGILVSLPAAAMITKIGYCMVPFLVGWLLPDAYLKRKAEERQQEMTKSLPDTLDLLTVSVEAGLGFDQALSKVIEKSSGSLAEEFSKTIQEIQMGKPRREALKDLGTRTGNEDLVNFTGALVQADKLGINLGNVLRIQAVEMRTKRRQLAEEKAMKAPLKMLFPLIFFVFPALFIVVLGPAMIRVAGYFMGQ
jgi:tight adherence protein C